MSATLVIIDMQIAIDDPKYGKQGQPEAEANMVKLLNHWRQMGNGVVHIQDNSLDPESPYYPGKPSHAFKPEFAPLDHETVVEKQTNNAFIGTDLMAVLEEIGSHELVICGGHLEHCVESTVRMAGNLGFMVFLPKDCVISVEAKDINGKNWGADEVQALTLGIIDGSYAKVLQSTDLMMDTANSTIQ
ncbi:MAG: cysteine hydrolase family protein [Rhizobiaceae bacterium]